MEPELGRKRQHQFVETSFEPGTHRSKRKRVGKGREGKLTKEELESLKEVKRAGGQCSRCKALKKKCDGNVPCNQCKSIDRTKIKPGSKWDVECTRPNAPSAQERQLQEYSPPTPRTPTSYLDNNIECRVPEASVTPLTQGLIIYNHEDLSIYGAIFDCMIRSWIETLPFMQMENRFAANGNVFKVSESLVHHIGAGGSISQSSLVPISAAKGFSGFDTMTLVINKMSEGLSQIISSILQLWCQASNLVVKEQTFYTAFLKCLSFSAANNFAGLDNVALHEMFDLLQIGFNKNYLILRQFLPDLAYKTLAKKVFEYAIETGKEHIVEYLLLDRSSEIHANTSVGRSPIYLCYVHQHLAVAKLLLRHGADANQEFGRSIIKASRIDPELASVLLEAGAVFDDDVLKDLIIYGSVEVARRIMLKQKRDRSEWTRRGLFHSLMMRADSTLALEIVQLVVNVGVDINHHFIPRHETGNIRISPRTMLDTASHLGYLEVVQKLLYFNALPTEDTLTCAIVSRNQDLMRFLLDRGSNVSDVTTFGSSPFAEAVRTGNAELGRLLARSGALRHIKTWSSHILQHEIVLEAASAVGNIGISRALHTVAENIRDEWSLRQAFKAAIENNQTEMALNFIRRGIPVESNNLNQAMSHKNLLVVRAILNVGDIMFESNSFNIDYMNKAVELGNHSLIKDLITAGADVCSSSYVDRDIQIRELKSDSPLANAAKSGDMEMAKLLLDSGADVNWKGTMDWEEGRPLMLMTMTPLEAAVIQGNIEVVRLFIERGADPNNPRALAKAVLGDEELVYLLLEEFKKRYPHGKKLYGSQALKNAIECGKISMMEAIWRRADTTNLTLADYADEVQLASPFAWAIMKNQGASLIEAQTLLELGADPNSIVASNFETGRLRALEVAIATKSLPMVQLLLKHGADINPHAIKEVRRTPLQKAAETGGYDIVQLLLARGADVNAAAMRNGGGTALQLAATQGYVGIAVLLLKAGADVNAPPAKCYGRTALEGAAECGRVDMVKLFLEAGVEIEGPGRRYSRHAIELAKQENHDATLEVLMSYQRPTTEPVRPQALFADCEGWTFWALETDDGFEPWEGDLPADSGEQQEESWEIESAMLGPDASQPLASYEGRTMEGFLG